MCAANIVVIEKIGWGFKTAAYFINFATNCKSKQTNKNCYAFCNTKGTAINVYTLNTSIAMYNLTFTS